MATRRRWGSGARVDDLGTGKNKLLKAAITCFASKGVQSTTIEDIANAANVTRRTVYRYYGGKADLIEAVIDLERRRLFEKLQASCGPYHEDFPRMIEECAAVAATILSPREGASDLVSADNRGGVMPHMLSAACTAQWFDLLEEPYRAYQKNHPKLGPLEDIIEMLGRLVLTYSFAPATDTDIRRAIRSFLTLAQQSPASQSGPASDSGNLRFA